VGKPSKQANNVYIAKINKSINSALCHGARTVLKKLNVTQ